MWSKLSVSHKIEAKVRMNRESKGENYQVVSRDNPIRLESQINRLNQGIIMV